MIRGFTSSFLYAFLFRLHHYLISTIFVNYDLERVAMCLANSRMKMILARNSVFDCHLSPVRRQMAIENSVSNVFIYVRP